MNSSSFTDNLNNTVPSLPNIHYYNKVAPPTANNNEQNFIDTMSDYKFIIYYQIT